MKELKQKAYDPNVSWGDFFDIWLPLLLAANESHKTKTYYFGYGQVLTLHSYYANIEFNGVWATRL